MMHVMMMNDGMIMVSPRDLPSSLAACSLCGGNHITRDEGG